jgi:hypothetical protein
MTLHLKAGQPATREMLVDVSQLEHEYYVRRLNLDDPRQLVSFGTSGIGPHRSTRPSLKRTSWRSHKPSAITGRPKESTDRS